MVFIADDLAAWLVGLLADAGRRRLTTVVLGDEQQRSLRSAATVAVRRTAEEVCSSDPKQVNHAAMIISQVFSEPVPDPLPASHKTMVEALQTGIAKQLAVLDDATLTGTGKSSADVLGVPSSELAKKLSSYLLREIVSRGARGGPLAPLAAQLNHDRTHLQVQQVDVKIGELETNVLKSLTQLSSTLGHRLTGDETSTHHYANGVLLEWTREGPRVSMFDGTVISVSEMVGLLDNWMEQDKNKAFQDHQDAPDPGIAALIFSVSKACYDFYGRFPEEQEFEDLSTELARKYELFWRFIVGVISEVQDKEEEEEEEKPQGTMTNPSYRSLIRMPLTLNTATALRSSCCGIIAAWWWILSRQSADAYSYKPDPEPLTECHGRVTAGAAG